jgi:hypothetical protein
MFFIFALVAAYMVFLLTRTPPALNTFDALKTEAHKYSGVNPEEFRAFLDDLRLCELYLTEPAQGVVFLRRAIDHLQNLGVYNDYDIHEEIEDLAFRVGWEYERELQRNAVAQKLRFQTRYLNERLDE